MNARSLAAVLGLGLALACGAPAATPKAAATAPTPKAAAAAPTPTAPPGAAAGEPSAGEPRPIGPPHSTVTMAAGESVAVAQARLVEVALIAGLTGDCALVWGADVSAPSARVVTVAAPTASLTAVMLCGEAAMTAQFRPAGAIGMVGFKSGALWIRFPADPSKVVKVEPAADGPRPVQALFVSNPTDDASAVVAALAVMARAQRYNVWVFGSTP